MKTIRWGIIGCGDVTEVKSGPGFQKAKNSNLVAVMRRNGNLAADYARRHGVPKWYDNAEALIQDPEVDAVYVATPPYAHKTYTLKCAQAGKPVYVEKPMAMNYAECQEMLKACRSAGVPLFVAYYRRSLPRFLKVKDLLDAGAIGEVRGVTTALYLPVPDEFDWHYTPEIGGGGKFVDMGCHTLDFLDYVLGPIRSVKGFAGNLGGHYPVEDIVAGAFEFESGVQAVGIWSFTTFNNFDQTEIIGTQGKISFSSFDAEPITLTTIKGVTEFAIDNPLHVHQPLTQTIVDELNGLGHCPSTGESGARTNWVMDQLLEEYRKHRD
ncbi:MAG: Gfo/Idh/MocA family oxidoreductase [Anaerolineae bacterium]|nr:Gfo/Idh/MocA family oxidoreductase [Anaerolineae bacterium]